MTRRSTRHVYCETTTGAGPGPREHGVSRFDGKAFHPLTVPAKAAPADAWKLQPGDLWFGGGGDTGTVLRYDGKTLHRLTLAHTREGDDHFAKYPRSKYTNPVEPEPKEQAVA